MSSSRSTATRTAGLRRSMDISGLEDEYRLSGDRPKLVYVKDPAPERDPRLDDDAGGRRARSARDLRALRIPRGAGGAGSRTTSPTCSPTPSRHRPLSTHRDRAGQRRRRRPPVSLVAADPARPTSSVACAEVDERDGAAAAAGRPPRDAHRDGRHRQVAPRAGGGATRARDDFPGGVVLVAMSEVPEAGLVLTSIAAELGIHLDSTTPSLSAVAEATRRARRDPPPAGQRRARARRRRRPGRPDRRPAPA